jgi:hypothetical protein
MRNTARQFPELISSPTELPATREKPGGKGRGSKFWFVVLGRHLDQLKFLEVMFGDEPPLTPSELIYQRMLARDPVEAAEQARAFLKEKPLAAYYDEFGDTYLTLGSSGSKQIAS